MTLIYRILQQALVLSKNGLKTRNGQNSTDFQKLTSLVSELRADHLNFEVPSEEVRAQAPVSYIEVFNNDDVNISVFVLNHDTSSLPLHDHPGMHGFLKVIYGTVEIQSFSLLEPEKLLTGASGEHKIATILKRTFSPKRRSSPSSSQESDSNLIVAVEHDAKLVSSTDPPCILSPKDNNLHKIISVGGPAAFCDILMPRYAPEYGRDCTYFERLSDSTMTALTEKHGIKLASQHVFLEKVPSPISYWCKTVPYMGPSTVADSS